MRCHRFESGRVSTFFLEGFNVQLVMMLLTMAAACFVVVIADGASFTLHKDEEDES